MGWKRVIVAAIVVVAAYAVPSGMAPDGVAGADPAAPAEPKTTIDHDGTYSVGTDIAPGTYTSAGPVSGGTCYWKRLSSPDGKDIIDNALSSKPQVVQIEASDKAFKTDGCQPWQKTDGVSADGSSPGDPAQQPLMRIAIDALNGYARQAGGAPLPPP